MFQRVPSTTSPLFPTAAEPPSTPFDRVPKRARTGPSPKNSNHIPRQWVTSEENIAINRLYSYAEWWGATTDFCWRCPDELCGAVWTLYPTHEKVRGVTGVQEVCHHPGGEQRVGIPHQCDRCWTEWKPSRALPNVAHPAFACDASARSASSCFCRAS